MAVKYFDSVGQFTATTGTGTVTLGSVLSSPFFTFAEQGAVSTDQVYYRIDEAGDVEIGIGTLGASAATLTRDTVLKSRIGGTPGTTRLTLAGAAQVRCVLPSKDLNGFSVSVAEGRLTLESGVPVSTSDQLAKGTLYWTPYRGNKLGLYVAGAWVVRSFAEVSLSLSGFTSGAVYDIFAYDVAGTVTLEAVVWASTTARATALVTQDGILVKSGDATRRFLGSMVMSATGQTQVKFGGSGPGGVSSYFGISNYYNKVAGIGVSIDTTGNWTYATNAVRPANNSTSNRTTFVTEVSEDTVEAKYSVLADGSAVLKAGVAINSTTNSDANAEMYGSGASLQGTLQPAIKFRPAIGVNYVQAVENSPQAVTITFYAGAAYFRFETLLQY